jgi:hypothetical protein
MSIEEGIDMVVRVDGAKMEDKTIRVQRS